MNYLDTMDKRFSMNFLDTVDSPATSKRTEKSYLEHVLKPSMVKKFSMNFLDTLDKPIRKRFETLDKPIQKRFTMNFRDTLGPKGYLTKHHRSHHRREDNGKTFLIVFLHFT